MSDCATAAVATSRTNTLIIVSRRIKTSKNAQSSYVPRRSLSNAGIDDDLEESTPDDENIAGLDDGIRLLPLADMGNFEGEDLLVAVTTTMDLDGL